MTNTQVTLIQIDNYGPWTTTPEPRREVDLQTLQSRLYADVSQLVGNREGYAFFGRFDNMVTVTNGLGREAHELIQESIGNRYPVTASMSVAVGPTPVEALGATATLMLAVTGYRLAMDSWISSWASRPSPFVTVTMLSNRPKKAYPSRLPTSWETSAYSRDCSVWRSTSRRGSGVVVHGP